MPNPTRDEIRAIWARCEKTNRNCRECAILSDHSCPDILRALLSAFEREEKMRAVLKSARHYMWSVGGLSGHIKAQELDAAIKAI